jgi:8-oxo-dGTP pyrophosphatase MutT (NUDIX family)
VRWKVTSSRYLNREEWATLRADTCEMPSGRMVDPYFVLEYPDWVSVVAVTADNQVVLVRQYRHALGEVLLELPGGCVDAADESPQAAMRRELLEETGFTAGEMIEVGVLSPNPATHDNLVYTFLATGCVKTAEPCPDPQEEIEVLLIDLADLAETARTEFTQAMHVASVFLALPALEGR